MHQRTVPIVLLAAALLGGCNILSYPLYVLAPRHKETVPAEFSDLAGKTVAIVVYADMDTLWEYPGTRNELGILIGKQLEDNIKGVKVINPFRVTRYQKGNLHWESQPMTEIGRALQADYVLYVSLNEFTTREPGTIDLPAGRVSAAVSLWKTDMPSSDPNACVWHKNNLAVHVDATSSTLAWNRNALRLQMQRVFADRLAKHFYDHEVTADDGFHDQDQT